MPLATYKGITFDINGNGHLNDPKQFCKDWVEFNAEALRMKLTQNNFDVIEAIRKYYKENSEPAPLRYVCKTTGLKSSEVQSIFPGGYSTAILMAGL